MTDPLAHWLHDMADSANDSHDHDEFHAAGEVVELIAKGVFFPDESSYIGRWLQGLQEVRRAPRIGTEPYRGKQ